MRIPLDNCHPGDRKTGQGSRFWEIIRAGKFYLFRFTP